MWRLRWDKLATFDKIRLWGREASASCAFCNAVEETTDHLFFRCSYSKDIWLKVASFMGYPKGRDQLCIAAI